MGGLSAARALVEAYDQVTVVERDELPAGVGNRRGVPQGKHFHTILLRGAQVLEEMFPGLSDELVAAGAVRASFLDEARFVLTGHELVRTVTGASDIQATRPMLEGTVRARVEKYPGVRILAGCDVAGPVVEGDRVTGVRIVRDGAEEVLDADLVVDAMGRSGRARAWLTSLGYPTPAEDRIDVDMMYVSRLVRPDGRSGTGWCWSVRCRVGRPGSRSLRRKVTRRWSPWWAWRGSTRRPTRPSTWRS